MQQLLAFAAAFVVIMVIGLSVYALIIWLLVAVLAHFGVVIFNPTWTNLYVAAFGVWALRSLILPTSANNG